MKIRNGFVSNSSSSSFVVIAPQKAIDEALEKLDECGKKCINEYVLHGSTTETIGGQKLVVAFGEIRSEDFGYGCYKNEDDYYDKSGEDWESFSESIINSGGIVKKG